MNRIFELEVQNLQDTWSILYLSLAKPLLLKDAEGESVLRSAVRRYGTYIGTAERKYAQGAGKKINLANFYTFPQYRFYDPRLAVHQQRLNEQVALFDVIRCPFAQCMRLYGGEFEGKVFCEEYSAACIEAYTGKVAQVNLSEVLTEPQNTHCRVACYYRPGNFGENWHSIAFDSFEETAITSTLQSDLRDINQAKAVWNQAAKFLVQAFSECETNIAWSEDLMTAGIQQLAAFLKMRATSMEQTLNMDFLARNCALDFSDTESQPLFKMLCSLLLQILEM